MTTPAVVLMERLGLSDDELCSVLDVDPLTIITDDLAHRPEIAILLTLTEDVDPSLLRSWLRTTTAQGRPIDLLLARDFGRFEDAVADLQDRGFVLRGGGG